MLKKSTLLFIGTFFLLFIGLSDYGYGCHKGDGVQHGQKPCVDDGGDDGKGTPVKVTFDDIVGDSIQSDNGTPYVDGEGVSAVIPDQGDPPGQFVMNQRSGGGRNLRINFGPITKCDDGTDDCVEDDRRVDVECPFPRDLRTEQPDPPSLPQPAPDSCSALVRSTLFERTAFDDNGNEEYILDMNPGTVKKVRSITHGEWDIQFRVPRPNGNKNTHWFITFSDVPSGHCDPGMEPEFLSIGALDLDPNVGGALRADTWNIGTFDQGGFDVPRLACLSKAKGGNPNEFVGFFSMSFMYTIEIK